MASTVRTIGVTMRKGRRGGGLMGSAIVTKRGFLRTTEWAATSLNHRFNSLMMFQKIIFPKIGSMIVHLVSRISSILENASRLNGNSLRAMHREPICMSVPFLHFQLMLEQEALHH